MFNNGFSKIVPFAR